MTLDSVIIPWRSGDSPEAIQEDYPSVPLAGIYGAVAYYLEHRDEVEQYLHDTEQLWHELSTKQEAQHGAFLTALRNRFAEARANDIILGCGMLVLNEIINLQSCAECLSS